jgi:hypothetical protein
MGRSEDSSIWERRSSEDSSGSREMEKSKDWKSLERTQLQREPGTRGMAEVVERSTLGLGVTNVEGKRGEVGGRKRFAETPGGCGGCTGKCRG